VIVVAAGSGAWPQLAGRFEQRAAQVLQQPQPVGRHGQAAPAAGGTIQHGLDQGQAAGLAGEPTDDPGAAAGLAEGPLDEVRMPGAVVVLSGEPQVGGRGNLVVFRKHDAFVGSGAEISREHLVIDVSRGKRSTGDGTKSSPKPPRFTNEDVHVAILREMRKLGLPDLQVEERLFVNGRHVHTNPVLLPAGENVAAAC
jgi:hypothetical protein